MIALKGALGIRARRILNVGASRRSRLGSRPTNGGLWKRRRPDLWLENLFQGMIHSDIKLHTSKSSLQCTQVKFIVIDEIDDGEFSSASRAISS